MKSYRLHSNQLPDTQQLENLEGEVRSKISNDIKCTLCIFFEKENLKTNVSGEIRIENNANTDISNLIRFIRKEEAR